MPQHLLKHQEVFADKPKNREFTEQEIRKALADVVDGASVSELVALTGLSEERCQEIQDIGNSV